jgi:hypothetical protein
MKDKQGRRLSFYLPTPNFKQILEPLEAGLVYLPFIPQDPSPPEQSYPVLLMAEAVSTSDAQRIRPHTGGRPTRFLKLSPFKLKLLGEIAFGARERGTGVLEGRFHLLPGRLEQAPLPKAKYEALWKLSGMKAEQQAADSARPAALRLAKALTRHELTAPLREAAAQSFAALGSPLLPGEVIALGKILTYTMENGLVQEQGFDLEKGRWFQHLCYTLGLFPEAEKDLPGLITELYPSALWDAVMLAFYICQVNLNLPVGDAQTQRAQAEAMEGLARGLGSLKLDQLYLPLVLAGLVLHDQVALPFELLSQQLQEMEAALNHRQKQGLLSPESLSLTQKMLARARQRLR